MMDAALEVDKTANSIYDAVENMNKSHHSLQRTYPDTISAKTVSFKNGKIYRVDTVKLSPNKWKIVERQIDKWGNLIHK